MRTARTKVYQFSELSETAQQKAIEQIWIIHYYPDEPDSNPHLLRNAILELIISNEYEFTVDGNRF